jgi:hypothetical protein
MASSGDWLPRNHEALYDKAEQTKTYLSASENRTRIGLATGTLQGQWFDTVFVPSYTAFTAAFKAWQNPATRTQIITATLSNEQKSFTEVFRKLYKGFLKDSPFVTNADLVAMGMPEHSGDGHTPSPVPMTCPEFEILLPSPGIVVIHFRGVGSKRRGKPGGAHGAEIVWAVLDVPPVNWSQLVHSSFETRTPFRLTFEGDQRGKHLYFALRWENSRGVKGPWSPIQAVIIP